MSYEMAWMFVVVMCVALFVIALRADERERRENYWAEADDYDFTNLEEYLSAEDTEQFLKEMAEKYDNYNKGDK